MNEQQERGARRLIEAAEILERNAGTPYDQRDPEEFARILRLSMRGIGDLVKCETPRELEDAIRRADALLSDIRSGTADGITPEFAPDAIWLVEWFKRLLVAKNPHPHLVSGGAA
jgi:hypothetical protein